MFVGKMKILTHNTKQNSSLPSPTYALPQTREQTNEANGATDCRVSITSTSNDFGIQPNDGGSIQKTTVIRGRERNQKYSGTNKGKYHDSNSSNSNSNKSQQQKYNDSSNTNTCNNINKNKKQHNNNSNNTTSSNRKKMYQQQSNVLQQKKQYHSQPKNQQQYLPATTTLHTNQQQQTLTARTSVTIEKPTALITNTIHTATNNIDNNSSCTFKNRNCNILQNSHIETSVTNNILLAIEMQKRIDPRLHLKSVNNNNSNTDITYSNKNSDKAPSHDIIPASSKSSGSVTSLPLKTRIESLKAYRGTKFYASSNKTNKLQDFVAAGFAHKCRCQMNSTAPAASSHSSTSISRKKNVWKTLNAANVGDGEEAYSSCANCMSLSNSEANVLKDATLATDLCHGKKQFQNVVELSDENKISNHKVVHNNSLATAEYTSEDTKREKNTSTVDKLCGLSTVKASDIALPLLSPDCHDHITNSAQTDMSNKDDGRKIENQDTVACKADSKFAKKSGRGPLSPNAYSLDFLHSVGVQMNGGANISSEIGSYYRISEGTNVHPANRSALNTSQRSTNSFSSISHYRPPDSAIGDVNEKSNEYYFHQHQPQQQLHHHHHRHHHHRHHPSKLTIASFLQKDLFGDVSSTGQITTNSKYSVIESLGNYNDQRGNTQKQHNARHPHYHSNFFLASHFQQQQNKNGGRYSGGVTGVSESGTQRYGAYLNYHDAGGSSNMQQFHHIKQHPHVQHVPYQNKKSETLHTHGNNKKSSHPSSSASSSSSSSTTSNMSCNSQQKHQHSGQQHPRTSSHHHSVLKLWPPKFSDQNFNPRQIHHHRGSHYNYQSHPIHYANSIAPTTPQHKKYFNHTCESSSDGNGMNPINRTVNTSRTQAYIPTPHASAPSAVADSADELDSCSVHSTVLSSLPQNCSQGNYSRYMSTQASTPTALPQDQEQNYFGKRILLPLIQNPLNTQHLQVDQKNITDCSQLDDATTVASGTTTGQTGTAVSYEYDSDTSSSHSISRLTGGRSLQSTSTTQIVNQDCRGQLSTPVELSSSSSNLLRPFDLPSVASTNAQLHHHRQHHHQRREKQQHNLLSQEQQAYNASGTALSGAYSNDGVMSLLNHSPDICAGTSSNFLDGDQHHHHQQHRPHKMYRFEKMNIGAALSLPKNVNNSISSSGYWSPSQQPNVSYPQLPLSMSPCLTEQGHDNIRNARIEVAPASICLIEPADESYLTSSIGECSSVKSSSSGSSLNGQSSESNFNSPADERKTKSGSSHLLTTQQRPVDHKRQQLGLSSPMKLHCSSSTHLNSFGLSPGIGRNKQHHGFIKANCHLGVGNGNNVHHQQLSQNCTQQASHPSYHLTHNPFFNTLQGHNLRTINNTSIHDSYTHTPPDRFLARAHLIEAKETPCDLLNNSKWDNLSQCIWNKFLTSQQTEETFKQKMHLWRYLYLFVKSANPRYGLYLVGSTISGFGSDTSDVDMCLVSRSPSSIDPRMEALFNLTLLRDCLEKSGEFEHFNLIEARVPILRFRDRVHQLEVDLNYNNCVGIKNTHLLYCYSQLDWRLRPLVLVTKLWAQHHNINNAKNMTVSSYSLVLMVIHFLQYGVSPPVLPCLHDMFPEKFPLLRTSEFGFVDMNETFGPYESNNFKTIGELFLDFLEYYSCFNYTQNAISVRTGGTLPINVCRLAKSLKNDPHQWKILCIEEPFDLTNTARSVYDYETFERVKAVFISSWHVLHETLDLNSVFESTIEIRTTYSRSLAAIAEANATCLENLVEETAEVEKSSNALPNEPSSETAVDNSAILTSKNDETTNSNVQSNGNISEENVSDLALVESFYIAKHVSRNVYTVPIIII